MKTTFRKLALALAAITGLGSAHAGVLTWQDVVFTTTWNNNVLTLEIDAANRSGDWKSAALLDSLSIKGIGSFDSVTLKAAPAGVGAWTMTAHELNGNGCRGGLHANQALCLTGTPVALADDMVFSFAFTGAPVLEAPHLKVYFLDSQEKKAGDLLSQALTASPAAPPVIPPVVPPVVVPPVIEVPDRNEVPEPQTFALVLAGLALMTVVLRKRS